MSKDSASIFLKSWTVLQVSVSSWFCDRSTVSTFGAPKNMLAGKIRSRFFLRRGNPSKTSGSTSETSLYLRSSSTSAGVPLKTLASNLCSLFRNMSSRSRWSRPLNVPSVRSAIMLSLRSSSFSAPKSAKAVSSMLFIWFRSRNRCVSADRRERA
ncbi:unnamed protein product [Ixodes pacificus]